MSNKLDIKDIELNRLSQKRGLFNKKKFILKKNKLIVEEISIRNKVKYEIDLDKIGYKKYYEAENTTIGKIVTIILFVIPFFFIGGCILGKMEIEKIIFITLGCWFFVIFSLLKSNKDDITLIGDTACVSLYRNKPNEEAVSMFIDEVVKASKQFTKNKYLSEDYSSIEEYYYMLKDLRRKEILSNNEFTLLYKEFLNKFLL